MADVNNAISFELKSIDSEKEGAVSNSENKTLLTQSKSQRTLDLCQKFAVDNWRSILTIVIIAVDYFLVYAAISLIGAFFPTKVICVKC